MRVITAYATSVALFGGIATGMFLFVGGILIWAAFLAWANFYHSGGDDNAFKDTVISNLYGVFVAWAAALIIVGVPGSVWLGDVLWPTLVVTLSIWVYIMGANISWFASIPGATVGYAATFAFLLQTPDRMSASALTSVGMQNVIIVVPVSMFIGALFALGSARLAKVFMNPKMA